MLRVSGEKYTLRYVYDMKDVYFDKNGVERLSSDLKYTESDLLIHLYTNNRTEMLIMLFWIWMIITRTASNYSMKRYWIRNLLDITTEYEDSSSCNQSLACLHSFSSSKSLYYSPTPIEGSYFSSSPSQPTIVSFMRETEEEESPKAFTECGSRLTFISSRNCDICKRTFCKNCCNSKLLRTGICKLVILSSDSLEFVCCCNDCYIQRNRIQRRGSSIDEDCYCSHQSLLQKWVWFVSVIISLFDTITALTPSWRESSVILSSSTLNESSLSLSASMLPPEAGALLEEPSSPEFVQFIQVWMMKRD